MKNLRCYLCVPILAASLLGHRVCAQPIIITAKDPVTATSKVTMYSGKCSDWTYALSISRDLGFVRFNFNEARASVDFTDTPFGKTFLHRPLAGNFAFTCDTTQLRVNFYGFDVSQDTVLNPVEYRLRIDNNGRLIKDFGLLPKDREIVIRLLVPPTRK